MKPKLLVGFSCVLAAVAAAGCAHSAAPTATLLSPGSHCEIGDSAFVRDVIFFGRNKPMGGTVSDEEWRKFLDEVVTSRFPDGLTVVEATGQWKGASGRVEQERSEIVTIFHSGDEKARSAIAEVAAEYKRRFSQEAVLRDRSASCARFE